MPLLIASGALDPVGDAGRGVKKLYDFYVGKAGMKNVSLTLFDGSRHEFLNERVRRGETYNALLSFFESVADGSARQPLPHNGKGE